MSLVFRNANAEQLVDHPLILATLIEWLKSVEGGFTHEAIEAESLACVVVPEAAAKIFRRLEVGKWLT
ncbi:MAG: hypothetical protein H6823_14570 [Planctomycetaceae bacterium]|nr:hypothetical protein [Planctomycetaceae bacterium]